MGNSIDNKRIILIGGCSRSGTTMLGAMLGNLPGCITTPESQFKNRLVGLAGRELDMAFRNDVLSDFRFRLWGLEHDWNMEEIPETPALLLFRVVDVYARQQGLGDWNTWIDHTPENIRLAARLDHDLDTPLFIHIVRDGRGVANSIMPLGWGPNDIIEAAAWWVRQIAFGLAAENYLGERGYRVRYEDLVTIPESTGRKLCDWAGLKYRAEMKDTNSFQVPDYTRTQHTKIGYPVDPESGVKWKTNLPERDIEIFEYLTGDLLKYLDYEMIFGAQARAPSRLERWRRGHLPQIGAQALRNRLAQFLRRRLA